MDNCDHTGDHTNAVQAPGDLSRKVKSCLCMVVNPEPHNPCCPYLIDLMESPLSCTNHTKAWMTAISPARAFSSPCSVQIGFPALLKRKMCFLCCFQAADTPPRPSAYNIVDLAYVDCGVPQYSAVGAHMKRREQPNIRKGSKTN